MQDLIQKLEKATEGSERALDPDHERATMDLLKAATAVLERRQRKLEGEG